MDQEDYAQVNIKYILVPVAIGKGITSKYGYKFY